MPIPLASKDGGQSAVEPSRQRSTNIGVMFGPVSQLAYKLLGNQKCNDRCTRMLCWERNIFLAWLFGQSSFMLFYKEKKEFERHCFASGWGEGCSVILQGGFTWRFHWYPWGPSEGWVPMSKEGSGLVGVSEDQKRRVGGGHNGNQQCNTMNE